MGKRKHDPLAQLTNELKWAQAKIDKEALSRIANIKASIAILKANIQWLSANSNNIARPPHSKLSDYTDEGLSRLGDELTEQGELLAAVGQALKAELLRMYGEPEAIKALRSKPSE
jgi:hypothetical protein